MHKKKELAEHETAASAFQTSLSFRYNNVVFTCSDCSAESAVHEPWPSQDPDQQPPVICPCTHYGLSLFLVAARHCAEDIGCCSTPERIVSLVF